MGGLLPSTDWRLDLLSEQITALKKRIERLEEHVHRLSSSTSVPE